MNVLITNTVLLNGGDAAILLGISRQVREVYGADTEITVADTQPDLAKQYYPDLDVIAPLYVHMFPPRKEGRLRHLRGAVRYLRWYSSLPRLYTAAYALGRGRAGAARMLTTRREWQSLRRYADADVVISTGGTYLVENYWLAPRIFDFRIALLLGRPLVLYTQSMGPFTSESVRRALRIIFKHAALVLLRDDQSMDNLLDVCDAANVNARLAADAAFALADPGILASAAVAELPSAGLQAAVSVRYWPFFESRSARDGMEDYELAVARMVEHLIDKYDAAVTFISTCQGVTGYTYDDSEVARSIVGRVRSDLQGRVAIDSEFHRPEELLDELQGFDLVIATRMHMAVLALAAGIPVLPISYEFKTAHLFQRLGLGEFVCDIEQVTGEVLRDTMDRLIDQLSEIRGPLFRRVDEERRRAGAAADDLALAAPAPNRVHATDDDDARHREKRSA